MSSRDDAVRAVSPLRDQVGESPVWSVAEQALFWIDIEGRQVRRYDWASGTVRSWGTRERIGSIVLREGGGLLAGMETGVFELDLPAEGSEAIERLRFPMDFAARDRGFTFWGLVAGGILKYHLSVVDLQRGAAGTGSIFCRRFEIWLSTTRSVSAASERFFFQSWPAASRTLISVCGNRLTPSSSCAIVLPLRTQAFSTCSALTRPSPVVCLSRHNR